MVNEFQPRVLTDLNGKWERYRIFMAPVNWRLESGDRFEVHFRPTGERLTAPFTIARLAKGEAPLRKREWVGSLGGLASNAVTKTSRR